MLIRYLKKPFRLECLHEWLKHDSVKVLDVGCGNHSPSITKSYYPSCHYYGLDKNMSYELDEKDFKLIEKFYEIDLQNENDFLLIPDDFFDCIILSHIIEHINNGEKVIPHLLKKLKKGGIIYLEFPSRKSIYFPSMKGPLLGGTLNFYDDPTHLRLYDLNEANDLLIQQGCTILRSGLRRSKKRIMFFPIYFIGSLIYFRHINGGLFWDLLGFAQYIIASKK